MALQELKFDDMANGICEYDRVEAAIQLFRDYEGYALSMTTPPGRRSKGFYIADSGGKDSSVIKKLAELSGVKYHIVHNHTTADHPETVYFVRSEQQRYTEMGIEYTISYPKKSMWDMISEKGFPPTRLRRYCCTVLKEQGGKDEIVVTGVRWAESANRKKRGMIEIQNSVREKGFISMNDNEETRDTFEQCIRKGKCILNPIIDWSDSDVWEFIELYDLPMNPLYKQGHKRVGCVGCPMNSKAGIELDSMPKYKNLYMRAFDRLLKKRIENGKPAHRWKTGEDVYMWWISNNSRTPNVQGQIVMNLTSYEIGDKLVCVETLEETEYSGDYTVAYEDEYRQYTIIATPNSACEYYICATADWEESDGEFTNCIYLTQFELDGYFESPLSWRKGE